MALMDWLARRVLARCVSNTKGMAFRIEVLQEAQARFGRPEIFNIDSKNDGVDGLFCIVSRGGRTAIYPGVFGPTQISL
jgi:hypothetical protein